MKFNDMEYKRPDFEQYIQQMDVLIKAIAQAGSPDELEEAYKGIEVIAKDIISQQSLCTIRHTVNTNDEFYDAEKKYFDNNMPLFQGMMLQMAGAILQNPHCRAFGEKQGMHLIAKLELMVKGPDMRVVPLMQEENALATQYDKIYAAAKIPFRGEELTVAQLTPYKTHTDREIRKEAFEAEGRFFDSCREEFDEIYDKLVKNRTEQAKILGYNNYCELSDVIRERIGYGRKDIAVCRSAVEKHIVPVVQKIKEAQAKQIGVDDFSFYDDLLFYQDGNPEPKGTPDEILANGQQMYRSLSPETAEFIDFMMDNDLFDVLSRPGKVFGGYCTAVPNYKAPFIFANFNGTAGDVDVLTHEAGHAFATFRALRKELPVLLMIPAFESCEIHSMSMEFLTAPYHNLFFKEQTEKYALKHAADALFFLPYGCMVDEFQEIVYSNPELTPEQRNQAWAGLEKRYRPWIDFKDIPFYGRGAGWQRQTHIYNAPFYYIDYVLAQVIALEFFIANEKDPKDAWQRYLALVEKAGTESYAGLVHAAGFKTPFEDGAVQEIAEETFKWIEKHPLYA